MKLFIFLVGVILYSFSLHIQAQPNAFTAGEYITEGGWGVMTLTKAQHFVIETVGGNGHTCNLEGNIQNKKAVITTGSENSCIVNFIDKKNAIMVSSADAENCTGFCGARANFEGNYLKVASNCTAKKQRNTRAKFLQLYSAKSYQKAYNTLEPLLSKCEKTLSWLDIGEIRNDIAITQYHLGQLDDCQKTLAPLNASVGKTGKKLPKTEQELSEILPPMEYSIYLPIAKATWYNWELCTKKK